MLNFVSQLSSRAATAIVAGLVVVLIGSVWGLHRSSVKTAEKKVHDYYAAVLGDLNIKAAQREKEYRQQETLWRSKYEEVLKDATPKIEAARLAASSAKLESDRLRRETDRLRRLARATPSAGGAKGGPSTSDALDLLTELFHRADGRAGELAEFADKSHHAGLVCQRLLQAQVITHRPSRSR